MKVFWSSVRYLSIFKHQGPSFEVKLCLVILELGLKCTTWKIILEMSLEISIHSISNHTFELFGHTFICNFIY